MRIRSVVKRLLPPMLLDLLRGRPMMPRPSWEGVHHNWQDVPVGRSTSYDSSGEIEKHCGWTRAAIEHCRAGGHSRLSFDMLAILAAAELSGKQPLRILDFGGAVGAGHVHLCATLGAIDRIEYHVVELDGMCEAGRQIHQDRKNIQFYADLSEVRLPIDIVYFNTVLQYFEDYRVIVERLADLGAKYIVAARFAGGEMPTFVTKQVNLKDLEMHYRFVNVGDLSDVLAERGYRLCYHGLGEEEYDFSCFPPEYAIERMRNLIYKKVVS